jgi:flagellar hook-associated protein 2
MPVRIAGLNSGMDTDAIVQDLVKAYSAKTDTYKKEQTRLQWKQDAWKSLNTKIYSFHTKFLSDMRFSGAYSKKKTSVSDETKASVVTSDTAVNGIQTLKVGSLARASYLTGGHQSRQRRH